MSDDQRVAMKIWDSMGHLSFPAPALRLMRWMETVFAARMRWNSPVLRETPGCEGVQEPIPEIQLPSNVIKHGRKSEINAGS